MIKMMKENKILMKKLIFIYLRIWKEIIEFGNFLIKIKLFYNKNKVINKNNKMKIQNLEKTLKILMIIILLLLILMNEKLVNILL